MFRSLRATKTVVQQRQKPIELKMFYRGIIEIAERELCLTSHRFAEPTHGELVDLRNLVPAALGTFPPEATNHDNGLVQILQTELWPSGHRPPVLAPEAL